MATSTTRNYTRTVIYTKLLSSVVIRMILGKLSRWIVQKGKSNPSDYDPEMIPSAWKSWLSKTRKDPPDFE